MTVRRVKLAKNRLSRCLSPFSSGPYRIRLARRKKGDRHRAMHVVFPGNIGDSARSQSPFLRLPFSLSADHLRRLQSKVTPMRRSHVPSQSVFSPRRFNTVTISWPMATAAFSPSWTAPIDQRGNGFRPQQVNVVKDLVSRSAKVEDIDPGG